MRGTSTVGRRRRRRQQVAACRDPASDSCPGKATHTSTKNAVRPRHERQDRPRGGEEGEKMKRSNRKLSNLFPKSELARALKIKS